MPARKLTASVAVLLGITCFSAVQAADNFATRLDTVPIDRRTQAEVTGNGMARAELDGDELTVEGSFSGLSGAPTEAWLHVGTAVGARGPAAHQLSVARDATGGTVSGTVNLSRREREALSAGRVYIQIHSEAAPEGNLWGWLLPQE